MTHGDEVERFGRDYLASTAIPQSHTRILDGESKRESAACIAEHALGHTLDHLAGILLPCQYRHVETETK